jgi:hypothetical protein
MPTPTGTLRTPTGVVRVMIIDTLPDSLLIQREDRQHPDWVHADAVVIDTQEENPMSVTLTKIPGGTATPVRQSTSCSWCYDTATLTIKLDGSEWTDLACQRHAMIHFDASPVTPNPRCEICGERGCGHGVCGICLTTQNDLAAHWDEDCTPVASRCGTCGGQDCTCADKDKGWS